jgi:tRNA dimethylallyltransferase
MAEAINGEIISADSMQVYIYMDIGTDKPLPEVRQRISHHLIDVVYPDQSFDAARYADVASQAIDRLTESGKTSLVVGGTGLYVRALIQGLFSCPPVPLHIRLELKEQAKTGEPSALFDELARVDPSAATRIHPNDLFRIIRALEIYRATGKPISDLRQSHRSVENRYRVLKFAIERPREELYRRIEQRVDTMIEKGLVEEVRRLLDMGYSESLRPMQSIGYRWICEHLKKGLPLDRAIELTKRDSRRYAKRQLTWFKADTAVRWFGVRRLEEEALAVVKNFLKI